MNALERFLAAGPDRRAALESALEYYIPPELRAWLGLANELNPVTSMERAGEGAVRIADPNVQGWDKVRAVGDTASNMAGVLAPVVAGSRGAVPAVNAMEEAVMGWSQAAGVPEFMADEFGGVGFRAYHGSPHDFDRFSLDKIGTGEGAQAYGHGLYFADNEAVANSYRRALAAGEDPRQAVTFRGQEMPDTMPTTPVEQLVMYMRQQGYTPEDAFERARRTFTPEMMRGIDGLKPEDFAVSMPDKYSGAGRMYEVQINADPDDFLDWDKPLSEQPARVRDALTERLAPGALQPGDENIPAKMLYLGEGPQAATERLRGQGIPGIRYLDAGSRGAGDGSRNYVVFDDKLIEIIRKYGWAAAAPMLAQYGVSEAEAREMYPELGGNDKNALSNFLAERGL